MKIKHILIALLLFPLSLMAQEKELTLQDLIPEERPILNLYLELAPVAMEW